MNRQHLLAFLWLRWRLRINQLKRGGVANAIILAIAAVASVVLACFLFLAAFALGLFALKDVSPAVLMYIWDGLAVAFLFVWMTGLLAELQRAEALSLDKFLHLPVSLSSAFLINYLCSLPSVSMLLFLPPMLGLILGLLFSRGLAMLLLLPMLAAFLLMVTALTYQFQGWLATLMTNPRRRRTVIVVVSMIFIVLCQAPNLVNILRPWERVKTQQPPPNGPGAELRELQRAFANKEITNEEYQKRMVVLAKRDAELRELQRALANKEITREEYQKRMAPMDKRAEESNRENHERVQKENEELAEQVERTARVINLSLPPGWLPAGVEGAAAGRPLPVLLGILGPALIGTFSLWRAYRTTLRLYTGHYTSGKSHTVAAPPQKTAASSPGLLEKQLPWLPEQAAIIALAAFRSLLRAPEAKMMLLTPILLVVIFGSMFLATGRSDMPEAARPLPAFGAMVLVLFSLSQLIGNQFGFDRNGFRVFVLSPAPRRDILLGKNLAVAPLALALSAVAAVFVQVVYPMRVDHFLALAPRFVSMYLLYCLLANALSILAPLRIAAGSFQPVQPGGIIFLWHFLFMFLCPVVVSVTLLPLGIESALEALGWLHGIPLDLLLSVLGCVAVVFLYGFVLHWEGAWLQARELRILQIVTTRAE
jgi:ABC-2 type transport system permease protein